MNYKTLIVLGLFSFLISCGAENLGKTDCAVNYTNYLDNAEDDYQELMIRPDSEGNQQSLEACLNRRLFTEAYIIRLNQKLTELESNDGCSTEEYYELRVRMLEREQDLEEDMESTWDRCEEVYGGG